jgi:hypothetical protein
VTGEWRKLHNEEFNDHFSSPNIVQVIEWSRIRWAGHVACMEERRGDTGFWWGKLRERNHLKVQDVDGRIILRWIFRTWDVGVWTGLSWLGKETFGGLL